MVHGCSWCIYRHFCLIFSMVTNFADKKTRIPWDTHGNPTLPKTNIAPENGPTPKRKRSYSNHPFSRATVDGRNPATVDLVNIPLFTGFHASQVVQDFVHQQYVSFRGCIPSRALAEDCKPSQGHLSMLASQCLSFNDAELREVREGPDLREDQWMVVSGGHFKRWGICQKARTNTSGRQVVYAANWGIICILYATDPTFQKGSKNNH